MAAGSAVASGELPRSALTLKLAVRRRVTHGRARPGRLRSDGSESGPGERLIGLAGQVEAAMKPGRVRVMRGPLSAVPILRRPCFVSVPAARRQDSEAPCRTV